MNKRLFVSVISCVVAISAAAQISSTLSPYSQFAMGTLAEQSMGFNRGMAGVGIGMRGEKIVNMLNPASYSAVDSLTMLFDVGMSGHITTFKEGARRINRKTGNFDYAAASFRLLPHVGVAVGIVPYSNIGYDYHSTSKVGTSTTTMTEQHDGEGGFSQVFLGGGWEFIKGFSVGFNVSYFWGRWDRGVMASSSDSYVNTLDKSYETSVTSYKLDFGVQWQHRLNSNNLLTVGATYSLGHKLNAQANMIVTNISALTSTSTVSRDSVRNALSLPHTFGIGLSLLHNNNLTLAADYQFQKWASQSFPMYSESARRYVSTDGVLRDRHKFAVGVDWIPNPMGRRSILQHVHYRAGIAYATPYFNMGNNKGPGELTVSAGFAVPISRSMINISGQWVRTSAQSLITENSFRLSIGLTFNERWFAKWKVD